MEGLNNLGMSTFGMLFTKQIIYEWVPMKLKQTVDQIPLKNSTTVLFSELLN